MTTTTIGSSPHAPTAISRRTFVAVLGSCAAAFAHASCGHPRNNDVVLGAVVARTGDRALWGEDLFRGIELATERANMRGGLLGRHVRLVAVDDASNDEHAGPIVARLCEEGAVAVLGELSTGASEKGAQAAQRRSVPFVGTANTLRDLSRMGDFVFRTALTDSEQAAALARHLRSIMQRRRAAVIYRRSVLYDLNLADAFAQAFRGAGGEVVLRDSYENDDAEMVRLAARIRAAGSDVVYAPASVTDAARVAVAIRHGRVNAQLVGDDDWLSSELRRLAADAINGAIVSEAFVPSEQRPEVEQFVQAFRAKYHAAPGTFAALAYDATRWVLSTAARIPNLDAHALRDALAGSRFDDAVAGGFAVDARRVLTRSTHVVRIDPDGTTALATAAP